jgi:hypothetical protein
MLLMAKRFNLRTINSEDASYTEKTEALKLDAAITMTLLKLDYERTVFLRLLNNNNGNDIETARLIQLQRDIITSEDIKPAITAESTTIGKSDTLQKIRQACTNKQEPPEVTDPDYIVTHSKPKTNKPIKRQVKTDYGIMWVDQDYGNDRQPIFFVKPNIVVRNRTNDLYKFALKTKSYLGPKWLRLIPYLSRSAVAINPNCAKMGLEERNLAIDQATRYFLKQKKEL